MKTILCVALALVHIPVFVLGGISIAGFVESTQYLPAPINACTTLKKDDVVKIAFGCVLLYDVFVVCLALFNALDRPRRPRHKIVTNLHRDGAIWFFMLFGFRMSNFLFFFLLEPTKLYYVIFLTWGTISLTLTRMIIRIESLKHPFTVGSSRGTQVRTWVPARHAFDLEDTD
ncbi:hypothetical protein BC629DRAFT_1497635 [Irpex lacteus]|nr:hypothetical protein BC629DRAFT_1497635 [Irpex lacteus]